MGTLVKVFDRNNLDRAWKWIRSNPDAAFKSYFRSAYGRYALADDVLLDDLHDRLQRRAYSPTQACKLYMPKRSGVLRPYSLLTIEDQIVYQALVNIVAEQLHPKVKQGYLVETFGHLYAGKSSLWFYRKWSEGYKKFNEAAQDAFKRGLRFSASFDLTACYDSLDHQVLKHFLKKIGCNEELCDTLIQYLGIWTATDHRIIHGHGIPQGPLGSGLLSEVVLQHFDQHYGRNARLQYLRYVDDIRLFAATEANLRKMLVRLDMLSKDIGLFPQSSKIEIHEVKDIDAELKSVSIPPEPAIKGFITDQVRLRKRLITLSPRFEITDQTRFKYLLSRASPHSLLNDRLIRILDKRPDLAGNVASYFEKYERLPKSVGEWILSEIKRDQLYPAVHSRLISIAEGRLRGAQVKRGNAIIKKLWSPNLRPEILASVGRWALSQGLVTANQAEYALAKKKDMNWWAKCQLIERISNDHYGAAKITAILNENLRSRFTDVAIASATKSVELNSSITPPLKTVTREAGLILRELGQLTRAPGGRSGIDVNMTLLLGNTVAGVDWRAIFGKHHDQVEPLAAWCRAHSRTDITSFVNAMDSFNDWLMTCLYAHDPKLGIYNVGSIGSVMNSTKLKAAYPRFAEMLIDIHSNRYESHLSHARVKSTGKPTRHIPFSYLKRAKRLMKAAFLELQSKW